MRNQRFIKYSFVTIFLAVLEFVIVLCISLVNLDGSTAQQVSAYILAAIFWISIITEGMFVHLSTRERRRIERREYHNKVLKHSWPGVISFFKNLEATVVDMVLFISAVVVVILTWIQVKYEWMIMAGISVLFLSFNLHCILNGKNYRYLKIYRLYKREHERDE